MASYKNFQNNDRKYAKSADMSKKAKYSFKSVNYDKLKKDKLKKWITFYRRNIHRFIEHYFGIELYFFQKIWLYLMHVSESFTVIGSRGISKTFLIAIYAPAVCVLYPGTKIRIAAGKKKQAGIIIQEKIKGELQGNHPNFAREIKSITANGDDWEVMFHNGSVIGVVTADDNARGNRSNMNIYEEFRLIKKEVKDRILSPFLVNRKPPYMMKKEYMECKDLHEESKEIYISSAYYKNEWIWDHLKDTVKAFYNGERSGFLAFDYLLSLKCTLITKKRIIKARRESDEVGFSMEYENIMYGEKDSAYYKLDMFKSLKTIKRAFYPVRQIDFGSTRNPHNIKKIAEEIRIICVDIAARKGKENDNTCITCIRAFPTSKGYKREIVYMESYNGANTVFQSLRVKQIFYDFNGDYLIIDTKNVGIAIFDQLSQMTKDEERGLEYPAYTIIDNENLLKKVLKNEAIEDFKSRTLAINAEPVVFPITATLELNSKIAVDFREQLKRKTISLLLDINDAETYLTSKNKEFAETTDIALKSWYLHPYAQINEMINETVNLDHKITNGNVKLEEPRSGRKDKFTATSYGNYFITLLEAKLLKQEEENDDWSDFVISTSDGYGLEKFY